MTLALVAGVGCVRKPSVVDAPVDNSVPPVVIPANPNGLPDTTVNVGPLAGASGGTTWFTYDSLAVFNEYVFVRPVNNPQSLAVNVDLRDIGGGRYAGNLRIAYTDNGQWSQGVFETGEGTNQVSYRNLDLGKSEAEFNQWFVWNGKRVFHAFFQDSQGAVILVIDGGLDLGDGGGLTDLKGSVWFKNFNLTPYPQFQEKCWFVRVGPYDCRTFVVGDWQSGLIQTNSSLYPNSNGYKRLGTFTGLNRSRAFND